MPRLLFEKKGESIWISHLDIMRVFQRAFKRAGLPLTHTQGFNPRPSVSIALPLSVGVASCCELLDFELDGCDVSLEEIRSRLNTALVAGICVLDVYEQGRKIRDLSLLRCSVVLEYDNGIPVGGLEKLSNLFAQEEVVVPKKTKNGIQEQNIIPMIRNVDIMAEGENTVVVNALICCQNPTLNPAQLVAAIGQYLPEMTPDFSKCTRLEIYDNREEIFR
ncbi:MAG: TIGR03936 family radical SAM-associated protein [Oscillospiraceae bacterium]|nr:TIGR03936 family radical SAM-associated protein [Oscillospiraceae bacterium]